MRAAMRAAGAAVAGFVVLPALVTGTAEADEATGPETAQEREALAEADDSGERVEVPSATTETTQVFAEPDGTFTLEEYPQPVRVRDGDGWTPVDTTLTQHEDGTIGPQAAAADLAFSAGGAAPMARIQLGSNTVELDWVSELPEPQLDGNTATYPDVLPDVDLVLTAGVDGFSQVLEVHSAEAAASPELDQLEFALDTTGVELSRDEAGNLTAAGNDGGEDVFVASAPQMWDSGGNQNEGGDAPAELRTQTPTSGDRTARVDTDLTPDAVTLTPDQEMLDSADTTYPVYIDPSVSVNREDWAYVDKQYPSTSYFNSSDEDTGVGYEPQYGHTKRAFWEFDVAGRTKRPHTVIDSATLRMEVTHAFGCTGAEFSLHLTGTIDSDTTWNNQPRKADHQDTVDVDHGRPGCDGPAWNSTPPTPTRPAWTRTGRT